MAQGDHRNRKRMCPEQRPAGRPAARHPSRQSSQARRPALDLHWSSLTVTPPTILDWEGWGRVPVVYDPRLLPVPLVAARVRRQFRSVLDTPPAASAALTGVPRIGAHTHQRQPGYFSRRSCRSATSASPSSAIATQPRTPQPRHGRRLLREARASRSDDSVGETIGRDFPRCTPTLSPRPGRGPTST